jgi:hypothetical protein
LINKSNEDTAQMLSKSKLLWLTRDSPQDCQEISPAIIGDPGFKTFAFASTLDAKIIATH